MESVTARRNTAPKPLSVNVTDWERIAPKIVIADDGCWIWQGTTVHGYGVVVLGKLANGRERWVRVHRISYTVHTGVIPDGFSIDHLCRNHGCCNPAHLEAVSIGENVLRGTGITATNRRKDTCKRGHALTPDNIWLCRDGHERKCKTCHDLRQRKAA